LIHVFELFTCRPAMSPEFLRRTDRHIITWFMYDHLCAEAALISFPAVACKEARPICKADHTEHAPRTHWAVVLELAGGTRSKTSLSGPLSPGHICLVTRTGVELPFATKHPSVESLCGAGRYGDTKLNKHIVCDRILHMTVWSMSTCCVHTLLVRPILSYIAV